MHKIPSYSLFTVAITLVIIVSVSSNSIQCVKYLAHLENLHKNNKTQFAAQMAPYLILSGKAIDDMGFGGMCIQNPKYTFTTVKMQATNSNSNQTNDQNFVYTVYYGLCFTSNCSSSDLNDNGQFIINDILQNEFLSIKSIQFIQIQMDPKFSSGALVICMLITVWMIMSLVGPFSKWFGQCTEQDHSEQPQSQVPIQMHQKLSQHDNQQQIEQVYSQPTSSFFHKISIGRQWKWLSTQQQTKKIMQFSLYKLLTIPIIIFGSIFYMNNFGSYNYFSFDNQIYSTFYSKISVFVYYLPDGFFFISGFVFARSIMWKCRSLKQQQTTSQTQTTNGIILKSVLYKFLRLYPIYIVCLIIFWVVVPSLHAGPIWNAYESQANACNSNWWKNIFMIDNFSNDGCFTFSWWVQLDMQYALLSAVFFFIFYYRKLYALIGAYVVLVTGWILVFAISAKMPVSLQHTLSSSSQSYFKSFHSHLPFYMSGLLCAFFCQKQSVRSSINLGYVQNKSFFTIGNLIAFGLMILILLRPGVWSESIQGFELGLCRFGVFLSLTLFFLPGMINQDTNRTKIHRMAQLSYPILLISGIVVMSSYWCLDTFPYTSGMNILNNTLPNFFLSVAVGIVLGLLFNVKSMLKG